MKKIKFYYSDVLHIRTLHVLTDAEGKPLYIPNTEPVRVKALPRITVASVYDPKEDCIRFGVAICSPKDVFKKSEGRRIAEGRARNMPSAIVRITKRNKLAKTSKRYADNLIAECLHKYVRTDI